MEAGCTCPKHSVVISESATPLSGADDEISDEESVKAQNRRKSSVLLVPEKKSRHSRRHEGGNCSNSFLFCKFFVRYTCFNYMCHLGLISVKPSAIMIWYPNIK